MVEVSDEQFEALINESMDELPQEYVKNMKNVAIVTEDQPTPEQLTRMHVHYGHTLYGLYEGIPLTGRYGNYSGVVPDKITIFKNPIAYGSQDEKHMKEQVKRTLWHEIAHHYGLNHARIDELQRKQPPKQS